MVEASVIQFESGLPDGDDVPYSVDALLERADTAARDLLEARDAMSGGTSDLVRAYEALAGSRIALVEELDESREEADRLRALNDTLAAEKVRLEGEIRRMTEIAREAVERYGDLQSEAASVAAARDGLQVRLDSLRVSHDALVGDHKKLTSAFDEVIKRMGREAKDIGNEGRRMSGMLAPSESRARRPAAPASLRVVEAADREPPPASRRPVQAAPAAVLPAPPPAQVAKPAQAAPVRPPRPRAEAPVGIEDEIRGALRRDERDEDMADGIEAPERREMSLALDGFSRFGRGIARLPFASRNS